MPDTTMLVGDTQYRGEPINPVSSGVNYSDLRPVGIAPPPAVAAPVAPPPVPTTWSTTPIDLSKYGLTQKDVDAASLLVPYSSAPKQAPVAAPIAPPPSVADQQKPALPSWQDYLAQQQAAFVPQTNEGWNPFNTQGQEQFTQFDKNAALKNFVEQGGKINYQDFLSSLPKDPGYGDVFSRALQGLGGASSAAQQWLSAYSPEFQKIGEFDPKNNPGGYLVSEIGNQPTLTRRRSDIGDNWVEYRPINSDGSLGKPKVEYQPKSGGLGSFLKTVAPIALGALAPGIGSAIGGALGATGTAASVLGNAIVGGATSAITGGDPLKGAALGGLGAGVSSGIGSLTSGLDPAIVKAAQGAGSTLVRGAVTGNLDPMSLLASAGTGYLSDTVKSQLEDLSPTKNLYEQNIAPGIKPEVSVAGMLENIGRNTAINAPGTLIRGGDLGNLLENTAIGELTKTATGYIPKTGTDFIDKVIGGTATQYATNELRDLIGASPSPVAPAPAPTSAPVAAAPAPASNRNNELLAILAMTGLMGDNQSQPQQAPQLFSAPQLAVLPGQLPGQLGGQPTSYAELMALLNTRRA